MLRIIITIGLGICFLQSPIAQAVEVYDKFDDFEKNLIKYPEKVYIVNYWATWCAPCLAEIPYFESLKSNFKSSEVEVVLVSLDFKAHHDSRLIPFLKRKNLRSRVIHLTDVKTNSWIDRVDSSWSGAIPATVFYQGKKKKFMEHEFKSQQELEDTFKRFINSN